MTVRPAERAVTIAGPGRTVDLRVPAGVPVADLLPQLARTVGVPSGDGGWELVPVGRSALSLGSTLATSAVSDGDVLHLRAPQVTRHPPDLRSVRDTLSAPSAPSGASTLVADLVSAVTTAALLLPLLGAPLLALAAPVDSVDRMAPSVAFVLGAVLLAMLGGWVAVRDPGSGLRGSRPARRLSRVAPAAAAVAWTAVAGGGSVAMAAPGGSGWAVVGGGVVSAFAAALVGGSYAARRYAPQGGWCIAACGAYGLVATVTATLLAIALGWDVAARLVAVACVLSVGVLPGLAVTVAGASRLDRVAATQGVAAATAEAVAARTAGTLKGALTGAVVVATLALASRWPLAGPADTATAGAVALLFGLRARTLGPRFAAAPIAGAALTTMVTIGFVTADAPVDRLLVTVAAVLAVLGVVRVALDRCRPLSPAMAAHGIRLSRWVERALIVAAIPVASGAVEAVLTVWANR